MGVYPSTADFGKYMELCPHALIYLHVFFLIKDVTDYQWNPLRITNLHFDVIYSVHF